MISYRNEPRSALPIEPLDYETLAPAERLYAGQPPFPTIAQVQAAVCRRFHLRPVAMHTQIRDKDICRPRQIGMYLCRELTPRSLPQIGNAFGGRDHTTALHAWRLIRRLRESERDIDVAVKALTLELTGERL